MKFERISIFLAFALISCHTQNKPVEVYQQTEIIPVTIPLVSIEVAKKVDFQKQLVSNGKLSAYRKTDMSFRLDHKIDKIFKFNGDVVKKGDLLASLESQELVMQFGQSKMQFDRATLDLTDVLIGLGYDIADSAKIPAEVFNTAKLRSGYTRAKSDYELADFNYQQRNLYSPINGIVANMFSKEMNFPFPDGPFCSIIDNSEFQINFPIMESELFLVTPGQMVKVQPYHDKTLEAKGYIKYINPVVDENGLVTVMATVNNTKGKLYEGMNVKVFVSQKIGNQLAVPKAAVTKRSGKDVVFTYKGARAQWNYVKIEGENDKLVVVTEGLSDGDTIIVEGNVHLAHLSPVEVRKNESVSFN